MLSRTWHGVVPIEHRAGFERYEMETGVRDTQVLPGNCGAFLKVVERGSYAHFFLCTLWEDEASMARYAGDDLTIARDYPRDAEYGLISDPIVVIQEVATAHNPFEVR